MCTLEGELVGSGDKGEAGEYAVPHLGPLMPTAYQFLLAKIAKRFDIPWHFSRGKSQHTRLFRPDTGHVSFGKPLSLALESA